MSKMSFFLFLYLPCFAFLFYIGIHFLVKKVSPKNKPGQYQDKVYECGLVPEKNQQKVLSIRFFVVAIIFLIFDIETTLMIPVFKEFKNFNTQGEGFFILIIMLSFLFVLFEGLLFCWKKGDLKWIKD